MKKLLTYLILLSFTLTPYLQAAELIFQCTFDEPGATIEDIWEAKGGILSDTMRDGGVLSDDGQSGRCLSFSAGGGSYIEAPMSIDIDANPISIQYYERFSRDNIPLSNIITMIPFWGDSSSDALFELIPSQFGAYFAINGFDSATVATGSNVSEIVEGAFCTQNNESSYDCSRKVQFQWTPGYEANEWVKVKVYIDHPSDPSLSDGTIRLWLNDILTIEMTNVGGLNVQEMVKKVSFFYQEDGREPYVHSIDEIEIYKESDIVNQPPVLELDVETASTNNDTYLLKGTVTDDNGVTSLSWSCNGQTGDITIQENFEVNIPSLVEGDNVVTVTAGDGQSISTDSATITYTEPLPTIEVEFPANDFESSQEVIRVTGSADDDKGVTQVEWSNTTNNTSGTATGTTDWYAEITLVEGQNYLEFKATDTKDKIATAKINGTYTPYINSDPLVTINRPEDGTTTDQATITVEGSAVDNGNVVKVEWVNGSSTGTAVGTSNWAAQVPLTMGENTITFTATDDEDSTHSDSITIIRIEVVDTTPEIEITDPTSDLTTETDKITISGTASDDNQGFSITWTNTHNGTQVDSGQATSAQDWEVLDIGLLEGENTIEVKIIDSIGQETTSSIVITYIKPIEKANAILIQFD